MTLAQLLKDVTAHYVARGFPGTAIVNLHSKITDSLEGDVLIFTGTYNLTKTLNSLVGKFPLQICESKGSLNKPQAIFSFSFGYRLKSRVARGEERRLPGINNRALAGIAARLKLTSSLPLYAQFEIADALDDYTNICADYSTPAKDMGTSDVINDFMNYAKSKELIIDTVEVVAHRHHIDRCILLLKDTGIHGIRCLESYDRYDPKEAQPRVVSPDEAIVSDFISMAAR